MQSEQELLQRLAQQIAKIEHFIVDLQKDSRWQKIFYNKKLFLNLRPIFKSNYIEYQYYLEDIIKDYNNVKLNKNNLYKTFYLERLEAKIFALFKVLRSLRNFKSKQSSRNDNDKISINSLLCQKNSLEKMLTFLDNGYQNPNKQLLYIKIQQTPQQKTELTAKMLGILEKKGRLEQDLFSITEQLKLYVD